jgi:hypothetical protein
MCLVIGTIYIEEALCLIGNEEEECFFLLKFGIFPTQHLQLPYWLIHVFLIDRPVLYQLAPSQLTPLCLTCPTSLSMQEGCMHPCAYADNVNVHTRSS